MGWRLRCHDRRTPAWIVQRVFSFTEQSKQNVFESGTLIHIYIYIYIFLLHLDVKKAQLHPHRARRFNHVRVGDCHTYYYYITN